MTSERDLSGLRVFVVEDEGLVAMLIEDYLDDLGCTMVASASRLEEALGKAAAIDMDVALLDVNLAGQLSYPVAELLRGRDVPFIFATGYGLNALPEPLRGTVVISKPFQQEHLAHALAAARRAESGDRSLSRQMAQ